MFYLFRKAKSCDAKVITHKNRASKDFLTRVFLNKYNVFLLLCVLVLFLALPNVNPQTSTQTATYDSKTLTYSIKNSTSNIYDIKLLSNTDKCGAQPWDCKAEFYFNPHIDYKGISNIWQFYNIKENMKPFGIDYRIKILNGTYKEKVPYYYECPDINGTKMCKGEKEIEKSYYRIVDLSKETFLADREYWIVLEGNKAPSASIEWIATIETFKLDKWASWTEADLVLGFNWSTPATYGLSTPDTTPCVGEIFTQIINTTESGRYLARIEMYAKVNSGSGTVYMQLYSDNNCANLLATSSGSSFGGSLVYIGFDFPDSYLLNSSTNYYVKLYSDSGPGLEWYYELVAGNYLFKGEWWYHLVTPVNITEIWLTSPDPDQKAYPPYVITNTSDNTPTFNLTTNINTNCYLSSNNSSWTVCSTTGTKAHICTQPTTLSEGNNAMYFNCSDGNTYQNLNITTFIIEDTIYPVITIDLPIHTIYNTTNITLNYTYVEINPDTCWYSLNNGTNTTITNCTNTTILATKKTNDIYVCMNDTRDNENCSVRTYFDVGMLHFCNGSTYPSLNFTFKDEDTNTAINGTIVSLNVNYWISSQSISKGYDYSSSPVGYNVTFCIHPNWTSLSSKYNITFFAAGYPQRKYFDITKTLSNSTAIQNLYLLATANGIYSTIQVVSTGNQVIIGASVTFERQIDNNWVIVMQDKTDSAGLATFWVNPNFDYRITVTAAGYASQTITIRPTQTIYTITMGGAAVGFISAEWIEGITYYIHPPSGILTPGVYNFSCIIRSTLENLEDCMFDLFYAANGTSYANVTGCNSTGGTLVLIDINFTQNTFGRVSVQINGSWYIIEADAHWVNISINVTGNIFTTIKDAIRETINMPEWGTNPQTADFSRIVFFFVIMAIILSVLNYYTGYDTAYPGTSIYLIFGLITVFTFVNGVRGPGYFYLVGSSIHSGTFVGDIWNNMIVWFFAFIVVISNALSTMRRHQ